MQLLEAKRPRRKPSLTPMIDVVFLLLVFFMLASRFGTDAVLQIPLAGQGGSYDGPPRLVDVSTTGLLVNGIAIGDDALIATLTPLTSKPEDMIILRGHDGATLQRITTVTGLLQAAGFRNFVLVE
ncbi:biopolymer transporter ExbD [Phaeobacter sp.]|uniref:ExbD/TolR family protein n=1 Tax=Phaeobacter sp. TaxID=1902409 RepID=UPI0025EA641D|nr:biopolymer transporter ExbD [Phaeobacter sp.]